MSIITFLIIIAVLIFVHELGHFSFAKKFGIRVDEFAIGFPPKIFSWIRGETKYSLNLIPFGGYVKIFGENPDEESMEGPDKARSFVNKPKYVQAMVLVAGILFNIIFAWILFSASFAFGIISISDNPNAPLVITDVVKDSPAEVAGLKSGDTILSLSSSFAEQVAPITPEKVKEFVSGSDGKEIMVNIKRDGNTIQKNILAKKGIAGDDFAIGIQMAQVEKIKYGFFPSIIKGAETTYSVFKETAVGVVQFLTRIITRTANFEEVAGPVGIVSLVGQASQFGFGYLLSFTALISINLAVINLIPFPALDGGRLFFVGVEAIIRRKVSPKFMNALNILGFVLLMIFMITVTISDVGRLFN